MESTHLENITKEAEKSKAIAIMDIKRCTVDRLVVNDDHDKVDCANNTENDTGQSNTVIASVMIMLGIYLCHFGNVSI